MSKFPNLIRSNSCNDIRDKLQKQNDFLDAYAELVILKKSCLKAGITVSQLNEWKREDLMFRKRFEEVQELVFDLIEDEAIRRAYKGFKRPIYQGGELVGYERVYSDALMSKILNARHPAYKDIITKGNSELPPLLILPSNGRELKELPSDDNRFEIQKEDELNSLEEIIDKVKNKSDSWLNEDEDDEDAA